LPGLKFENFVWVFVLEASKTLVIFSSSAWVVHPIKIASHDTVHTYFTHITSFVAQQHANATKGRKFLEPSSFLNVEVTDDQRYLLQPTASDVLVGNILEDSIGQNAKKKIPKRRFNMIAGNIASYSRVLNNEKSRIHR